MNQRPPLDGDQMAQISLKTSLNQVGCALSHRILAQIKLQPSDHTFKAFQTLLPAKNHLNHPITCLDHLHPLDHAKEWATTAGYGNACYWPSDRVFLVTSAVRWHKSNPPLPCIVIKIMIHSSMDYVWIGHWSMVHRAVE